MEVYSLASAIFLLLLTVLPLCSSLTYNQCESGDSIFKESNVGLSVDGGEWKKIFKVDRHDQCVSRCHMTTNCKSILVNETTCILKDVSRMSAANSQITASQMTYYEKKQCPPPTDTFIANVSHATDCKDIYDKGWKASGVYLVSSGEHTYDTILCEMTLLGGGWTVIQKRIDGTVDFKQNWANYQKGFGELDGNFWYGLDRIHNLTRLPGNEVLLPFETESGDKYYPMYDEFMVAGEDDDYRLTAGSKVDVLGTSLNSALQHHDQAKFTTYDNDNDESPGNCGGSSGWWFKSCFRISPNGIYGLHHIKGINWLEVTRRWENGNQIFENAITSIRILVRRKE